MKKNEAKKLYLTESGRYALDEETELYHGDRIEIRILGKWLSTEILSDGYGGYYANGLENIVSLSGFTARKLSA